MPDHTVCHRDIDHLLTEVGRLQRALKDVQGIIIRIDGSVWEEAQEERHPLWEALDRIDMVTMKTLAYQVERTTRNDGSATLHDAGDGSMGKASGLGDGPQ